TGDNNALTPEKLITMCLKAHNTVITSGFEFHIGKQEIRDQIDAQGNSHTIVTLSSLELIDIDNNTIVQVIKGNVELDLIAHNETDKLSIFMIITDNPFLQNLLMGAPARLPSPRPDNNANLVSISQKARESLTNTNDESDIIS